MSIYPHDIYLPYTYLIGWSDLNLFYYGSEYGSKKLANPNNLWTTYFTSSNYVKEIREQHGEPDVIEVRKVFWTSENKTIEETEKAARNWERNVLKRMNVISDSKWMNKTDGTGYKLTSEEISINNDIYWSDPKNIEKHSLIMTEVNNRPEVNEKRSNTYKEFWSDPEFKAARIKAFKEVQNRPEVKAKMKETNSRPDVKANRSRVQKEIQNRPEVRAKKLETISSPEFKAKLSKILKEAANRPEVKAKRIEAQNNPEVRAKQSRAQKEIKNNPEWRAANTFYCECCNKIVIGKGNWLSHLQSKRHSKKWKECHSFHLLSEIDSE